MIETYWKKVEEPYSDTEPGKVHPVVRQVLWNKGIRSMDEMKEFLSLKPKKTYDPFIMKGMKEACNAIEKAIDKEQHIVIYGDYDVDGVTSSALLVDFISSFYHNISFYIPDRMEEGYGLNKGSLTTLINERKMGLLITVDCGITSNDEIKGVRDQGIDVIITDHHTPGDLLPDGIIINPKQKDCLYPFKDLCGCGIAFKLAQGLQRTLNIGKEGLTRNLDLVALATVADVVPLLDENRTLLKYGLRKISSGERIGLDLLMEELGLKGKKVTPGHIGFVIGPHINAGGRVDHAKKGAQLLLTKDRREAKEIVDHLVSCNRERKDVQRHGLERCIKEIEENYKDDLFLVVDLPDLHEGVIGIIAGRIKDLYHRPVLILTNAEEEGTYKGSGRSIDGVDLYQEMNAFSSKFTRFGGHPKACGLSLSQKEIPNLREKLNRRAAEIKKVAPVTFKKQIKIHKEIRINDIDEALIENLQLLEPFGMGNEKPYFALKNFGIQPRGKISMGKEKNHLRLEGGVGGERALKAIGFQLAEYYFHSLGAPDDVDLAFFPEINEWRGQRSIQLVIEDIKEPRTDLRE